jgi:pimeloyl-ACP methyl ester carboxylesterase
MTLRQNIRFCTSADGTRIAVASCGSGPVLLRAAHWLSHVDYDVESPVWRPWLEALSRHHRFVRYDPRGSGLSDRHVADLTLPRWDEDLEAVAATISETPFVLIGVSQGGALAIRYALRHPERVSHLILHGAYAQGWHKRSQTDQQRLEADTLVNFVRIAWGRENPAFCQFFTNLFIPGGDARAAPMVGRSGAGDGEPRGRCGDAASDDGDRRHGHGQAAARADAGDA